MVYPEIEEQLLKVQLSHPMGSEDISLENNEKWKAVLNRFLVDRATVRAINGGRLDCSHLCLDEEGKNYQFKDTARFAHANCVHASMHLQCILSSFVANIGSLTCPIMDTPQCHDYAQGQCGEAHFWAPHDFYNFAKAFLRTRALTDAFLKPQYR